MKSFSMPIDQRQNITQEIKKNIDERYYKISQAVHAVDTLLSSNNFIITGEANPNDLTKNRTEGFIEHIMILLDYLWKFISDLNEEVLVLDTKQQFIHSYEYRINLIMDYCIHAINYARDNIKEDENLQIQGYNNLLKRIYASNQKWTHQKKNMPIIPRIIKEDLKIKTEPAPGGGGGAAGFKKYLKYKAKYLQLKNQLN